MKWIAVFLSFLMYAPFANAVSVDKLLKNIDDLYRSNSSFAEMHMTIKTPHWKRTLQIDAWTQGLEKSFMSIKAPKKDRGVSTLKINNQMWNYFPKINKVIKVPASMMMGSWMGSDFTNDDLVKENTYQNDFTSKLSSEADGKYIITVTPKPDTVTVWGKIEVVIDKKTLLPIEQSFFNENGKKTRLMTFSEVKKMGGKTIPTKMTLTPLNKQGHSTEVVYKSAKFNVKIPSRTFSKQNLQKRR